MKIIGLIGGMTWLSTIDYYKNINQLTNRKLGGLHSAKIILHSINFQEFQPPVKISEWARLTESFIGIAQSLENAGAECLAFCANTPHLIADKIQESTHIPLVHIAVATAQRIKLSNLNKVALLGTKITMEQAFFKEKLSEQKIESIIPDEFEREFIHNSIFNELGRNIFSNSTKGNYLQIINRLITKGAQGIIFGCTEIPLLIKSSEISVPSFDTTQIHCEEIVQFAVG